MTSKDIHSPDNAEFEQFLQGKGELAQQLQALDQPEPSAELDAAILARAERELVMHKRLSQGASNDPATPDAAGPRPSFMGRWRTPMGLAASVALGIFVLLQAQRGEEGAAPVQMAQAPAPQTAAAPPATPPIMVTQAEADALNGTVWRSIGPPPTDADRAKGSARSEPKSWLGLIEELLKAGKRGDALDEWKNFRKAHPHIAVPDKLLKELEPQPEK